jgi:hypothetical protein
MPRFDVHQAMSINGVEFSRSKVRMSGDQPSDAAVNWIKIHALPKADRKNVRILGQKTKFIEVEYDLLDGTTVRVEMIPVEHNKQCKDCGYPSDYPNPMCMGECEEFRNEETVVMDLDEANDLIKEMV